MRTFTYNIFSFAAILAISFAHAQDRPSRNFYPTIKNYDLSKLWNSDSIQTEFRPDGITFNGPIGFIGENFQRFYIHFIAITKSKNDPYLYQVTGKTRVKDNICNFTGQIYIQKAVMYPNDPDYQGLKNGAATCLVTLYEDSTQNGSGSIKGKMTTAFYIDEKGHLHYDNVMFTDGFSNNDCTATWTSYKTKKSKKCNWGDFRIPESSQLDNGASEFFVDEKYVHNGWENYRAAWNTVDADAPATIKARKEEARKWWKDAER